MHYPTPLDAAMYLKDLDRQAAPKLHPLRSDEWPGCGVTQVAAVIAFLRRLRAVRLLGHVASQS